MKNKDNPHANITNDAIRELQRQRAEHAANVKKVKADLRQLDEGYNAARKRAEAEYLTQREELYRRRRVEDIAAAKLDTAIVREQQAEADRIREEAALAAHVEKLRPALARLGLAVGGGV